MSPTTQSVTVTRRSHRRGRNRAGEILGEAVHEGNRAGFYGGNSPDHCAGQKKRPRTVHKILNANVIQASIHPRRLHKFRLKLKEGLLFSLSSFDVKKQGETYCLTDHAYRIFFNDQTTMDVVDDIVAQVSCIRNSGKVDNKVSPPNTSSNLILTCVFER
ncbi:unnamed protein product [Cochlearia groenlandica]